MEDWKALTTILGKGNVDEIKQRITSALIENIESNLNEYYLGDPQEVFGDFIDNLFKECLNEMKGRIKGVVMRMIENTLSVMDRKLMENGDGTQAQ